MSKIGFKAAAWLGVAVALVAMALAIGPGVTKASPVPGDSANTFDVQPVDSGLVGLTGTFTVDINLVDEGAGAELQYVGGAFQLEWDSSAVAYVSDAPGGLFALPSPPTISSGTPPGTQQIVAGGIQPVPTNNAGVMWSVTLTCVGNSSGADQNADTLPDTALDLVSIATDPVNGSATALVPGTPHAMVLEDGFVTCAQVADIVVTKDGPGLAAAGSTFDYVITMHNAGPNAAAMVTMGDNLPELIPDGFGPDMTPGTPDDSPATKEYVDHLLTIDGVPYPFCVFYPVFQHPLTMEYMLNVVMCDLSYLGVDFQPSMVAVLTITVNVPLFDAGKMNVNVAQGGSLVTYDDDMSNEADCAPLGLDPSNLGCDITQVVPTNMAIDKSGAPNPATAGDVITWTIDVDCLPLLGVPASSPCASTDGTAGPVITDDVQDNQVAVLTAAFTAGTGNCVINHADASGADKVLDPDVTCTVTAPMAPATSAQIEITTQTADATLITSPTTCDNDAAVTGNTDMDGDSVPEVFNAPADVVCNPAVCTLCIDKDSGVIPTPIAVLVGETATVTVWEQIEVVDPGANPNLIHLWIASSASPHVSEAWVESGTGTLDFSTGPHDTPGLFVISKELEVTCDAQTGPATVALDISAIGLINDSPTSLTVECYDEPAELKHPDQANIWIMEHPNCIDDDGDTLVDEDPIGDAAPPGHLDGDPDDDGDGLVDEDPGPCNPYEGKGSLLIHEIAYAIADADSPNDADSDPEGLGAYEKQVKFDHKIVQIDVSDAGYLGSTGRAVNCDLTIVTENYVIFGCVSIGSMNGPTDPGPVVLSQIWVTPMDDLVERIRPTKDNGVVTVLLDENCEWADIYGDPMLGMVGGGLVPVCGDATITIRMLEGDLNLDCNVDLLDEQAIAFRYGASFGLLLYDPWFDLEPKLTDFDIDIKDLQFVFGRDGSTCTNPIPLQPPSAPIP